MADISEEELNKKLLEFEDLRRKYLEIERLQLEMERNLSEIDNAIEELNNAKDDQNIYKLIGNILIKKDKQSLIQELQDRKKFLEESIKVYKNKGDEINKRLKILYDEIKKYIGKSNLITK